MTHKALPSPPIRSSIDSREWTGPDGWFSRLYTRVSQTSQLLWTQIEFDSSNLTDIETRNHSDLQNITGLDETDTDTTLDKHISNNIGKLNKDHRDNISLNTHGNLIDATITFDDGKNINFDTVSGTQIGTDVLQKLSFYGVTAIVQPTVLTTQDTDITHTAPGTPDYAIQDLTSATPFGFVTKDEGNTVLQVVTNLQTRVSELESRLQSLGLLA